MVSIELPDSGVCDTDRGVSHDISPDSLSSDSVESGHGRVDSRDSVESGLERVDSRYSVESGLERVDSRYSVESGLERVDSRYSVGSGLGRSGETSTNHILLNCERDVGVIRSKGSSPINDEVIIHNERSLTPPFSSSSSSSLYLKLVKYKEKPQSLEHYDTPRKRVDSRRTRVLPKNQLEWSDEATDDEGKRRMRDLYRGLPRIVPPHLQARDIEWTDDTDLDIKEDEVLPHDSEIVMTSEKNILSLNQESPVIRNFVDSSDDEYHSTHSDISVEDLSKLSSEHTNMSSHIDMPRQASGTTVLENSEDIIFISDIKANGDVNLPIEELKPSENIKPMELVKSDSSSSSKSGNLASNSLTIPTKHLVL